MLSNTLNTNEIKNAAGAEREFTRLSTVGRSTEFGLITEAPAYPHRLKISHQETGSGTSLRRRSIVRFERTAGGLVDPTKTEKTSCYLVLDYPIGNITAVEAGEVLANLLSFVATTGAATTVLFDGTGNGAVALLSGGL